MPVDTNSHEAFRPPPANARLWRYIDVPKYLDLLRSRSLWFSRVDQFSDKMEGSLTTGSLRELAKLTSVKEAANGNAQRVLRRYIYASCWHQSDYESAAMWALYMRDHGIAVVSSYRLMQDALSQCLEKVFVGAVKYIDYDTEVIPLFNAYHAVMHKRRSFEHEKEVRAVLQITPDDGPFIDSETATPVGLSVNVDLQILIEEVRIAPEAPAWFTEVVKDVTRRYGIDCPVRQSSLSDDPVY